MFCVNVFIQECYMQHCEKRFQSAIETVPHCRELTRLQIHGAGPKMAGFELKRGKTKQKTRGKKQKIIFDPVSISN